jgi:hypothetical protein
MGPQKPDSGHEPTRSFDLDHHETVEELRALPDEEIERRHDVIMRSVGDASVGDMERQIRIGRAHAYRAILDHAARDAGSGAACARWPSAPAGRSSVTSASIHSAPWKRATETRWLPSSTK